MWFINSDVRIGDSGILEGFTDYHCHLLPGVDDGVDRVKETLNILSLWEGCGVRKVYLTPHIMEDIPNKTSDLKERFEKLKTEYGGRIELHLAAENMLDGIFTRRLEAQDLLTLQDSRHILVETSYFNPPYDLHGILDSILHSGYFPVLAHPERYQYMDERNYRELKSMGVLFQLNFPSLVGAYDEIVKKKAEMLLEKGYYDLCGTDTHNIDFARFFVGAKIKKKVLKRVRQLLEK